MEAINVSRVCEIRHDRRFDLTITGTIDMFPAVSEGEGRSEYAVELTACFQFSINTTIEGPRGLTKEELEDRIEADWQSISVETDVLLESHWELDGFKERLVPQAGS